MEKIYVYNYDPNDYFYIGKTEAPLDPVSKKIAVPGSATLIKPPDNYAEYEIPVFDLINKKWDIKKDDFWRPEIIERSYNSGMYYNEFPCVPYYDDIKTLGSLKFNKNIPRLLNSSLHHHYLCQRMKVINLRIVNVLNIHKKLMPVMDPVSLIYYNSEIEIIIYLMKLSIDDIISMTYVNRYYDDVVKNHKIAIDSIGRLTTENKKYVNEKTEIKKLIKFDTHQEMIAIINDIHNGFKHDIFNSEAALEIGLNYPIVSAIAKKNNDFDIMEYHKHDLGQLVIGFSRFIDDNL
jgi:hypothetical protein